MPPQIRQAPPRLQRLHLRAEAEDRSRRRGEAQLGRQRPPHAETGCRRSGRGGFHGAGEGGQLRELRARRCLQVRWMSVYWAASVQAGRGSAVVER